MGPAAIRRRKDHSVPDSNPDVSPDLKRKHVNSRSQQIGIFALAFAPCTDRPPIEENNLRGSID